MFLPFGIGRRICLGRLFSVVRREKYLSMLKVTFIMQMEAKVLMVHLLRTFHVTLAQDYKLEIKQIANLYPKGGVPCTLVAK